MAFQRVVLPIAHRTKQNRIGFFGDFQGGFGQRMTVRRIRHATDQGGFHFHRDFQRLQNLHGFRDDFRSNTITG